METTWGLSEHGWPASSAFGHLGGRDMPHSLRFVFPRIMAHAWRSFDMIVDSVLYLAPTRACEPAFMSISSAVMKVPLTTKGIPWRGGRC